MAQQRQSNKWLQQLSQAGLGVALLLLVGMGVTGCDPNKYNMSDIEQELYQGRRPFVSGRVAVLACKGGVRPQVYPSGHQPSLNPNLNPYSNMVASNVATINILSVNLTAAHDYAIHRGALPMKGSPSGAHGYMTSESISIGQGPVDIAFDQTGNLAMVAMKDSNQIVPLIVTAKGDLQLLEPLANNNLKKPTRIAVSAMNDYAWVISEGNNMIHTIDLRRVDQFGNPVPRLMGQPFRASPSNIFNIRDIVVLEDSIGSEFIVTAASRGGLYYFDTDVVLGYRLPNPVNAMNLTHTTAFLEGAVGQYSMVQTSANLVAASPYGELFWNDLATGPHKLDGNASSLNDRGFHTTGSPDRVNGGAVKEIKATPDGNLLLAMTSNKIHVYDIRTPVSHQREPLTIGNKNSAFSIDPNGKFALVADAGIPGGVHILRLDPLGVSNNGASDTIATDKHCLSPSAVAIRTEMQYHGSRPAITAAPQAATEKPGEAAAP